MTTYAFWIAFYWIAIPLASIAIVWALIRQARERYGEPQLEGRLLFATDRVRAESAGMAGAPPYRMWISDREIVLRLRPGYKARLHTGIEIRIPVPNVTYILRLPDGKVRIGLKGDGRHWDFSTSEPISLLKALDALPLTSQPAASQ